MARRHRATRRPTARSGRRARRTSRSRRSSRARCPSQYSAVGWVSCGQIGQLAEDLQVGDQRVHLGHAPEVSVEGAHVGRLAVPLDDARGGCRCPAAPGRPRRARRSRSSRRYRGRRRRAAPGAAPGRLSSSSGVVEQEGVLRHHRLAAPARADRRDARPARRRSISRRCARGPARCASSPRAWDDRTSNSTASE